MLRESQVTEETQEMMVHQESKVPMARTEPGASQAERGLPDSQERLDLVASLELR